MENYPRRKTSYAHSTLGAGMNGLESTVHLLGYELHVASLGKSSLPAATHTLVRLLLRLFGRGPECRKDCFFNFTETISDYSFILNSELLSVLTPEGAGVQLELSQDTWRVLVVEVGALGSLTGISKIAASVICPLADWGVSVFCLSTNMDDYVMVKESDLEKALTCLAKRFKLTCDSSKTSDVHMVKSLGSVGIESPVRKAMPNSRPLVHPYVTSSTYYSVCGVMPSALPTIASTLLEYMLYNERSKSTEPFFSLSVIEEDISLVIDSSQISLFPVDCLYLNSLTWRMITIGEGPLGFDECGIVAQVAAPLAMAEISTFYICSFLTDHTLVPADSTQKALELLNQSTQSTSNHSTQCVDKAH